MQTNTRSATRLLFLLRIPDFPAILFLEGDNWGIDEESSGLGPISESLLSERFLALDEALSLWQDFTFLLADGPEGFLRNDVCAPTPSDEELDFSSVLIGELTVPFLSDFSTWH